MQLMTKRGLQWLSATAEDPEDCRAAWADDPRSPYALPAGRYFDVVVIEQHVGLETFAQLDRRGLPLGPVMADWGGKRTGFFLPSGSRERFDRMVGEESADPPKYRYAGVGSFVIVPGPMPLSGDRYTWLRAPMRRPEVTPARTAALAAMFVAAAAMVARADRYGEEYSRLTAAEVWGESADGRDQGESRVR